MIINQLDLGAPSNPWMSPIVGQNVGSIVIEGVEEIVWPRGSIQRKQTVSFQLQEWQAIGGATAKSQAATKYLLKQLEELASNRNQQPCLIQWSATADPAAALNATDLHDGWYIIEDFEPDYKNFVVSGIVMCRMTVTEVAPAPPTQLALAYTGGPLSSNYSGTPLNLITLPGPDTFASGTPTIAMEPHFDRGGGDQGTMACILSPVASPEPFTPPLPLSNLNLFLEGVRVYDTINSSSYAVPSTGGTYVNPNWVEVLGTNHDFVGDCVITNGLLLATFVANGSVKICTWYFWNTVNVANWQQVGALHWEDNSTSVDDVLRSYTLVRVGPEECSIRVMSHATVFNNSAQVTIRLQRGRYDARIDVRPLTQAATNVNSLLQYILANFKIAYNSTSICDVTTSDASPAVPTDYGYGCAFRNDASYPFIFGFLYQNKPGTAQPSPPGGVSDIGLGDSTSLAINATRSYGIFVIPFGKGGSRGDTSTLQAEGESGTLGTGWSSVADAAASGGNAAKAASGTVATNSDKFLTAVNHPTGSYDLWFRVRVTSAAGSTNEMTLGMWNPTASASLNTQTYKANQFLTTYTWVRVATGITLPAANPIQFYAVTAATLGTDWFIDEAVLTPKNLHDAAFATANVNGPQDIWQQFMYDRSVRLIRQ